VRSAPEDLVAYSYDAYSEGYLPAAAVIPRDARESRLAVRIAFECGEAVVPRGAGSGLCGGAIPARGGLVVSMVRMNRILELDVRNRARAFSPDSSTSTSRGRSPPTVSSMRPTRRAKKSPRSAATSERTPAGPHCLSYGTTTNHVLGVEYIDGRGVIHHTSLDDPGYDLTGLLVGSEGTLGS